MAVLQQIIKDKIPGTPASSVDRDDGNDGLLVIFSSAQTGRNKSAFGAPVFEKIGTLTLPSDGSANVTHVIPKGVLGDYHSSRQISVLRKGRVRIKRSTQTGVPTISDAHIGTKAFAMSDGTASAALAQSSDFSSGTAGHGPSADASGFGEIVGFDDTHLIVDVNFP